MTEESTKMDQSFAFAAIRGGGRQLSMLGTSEPSLTQQQACYRSNRTIPASPASRQTFLLRPLVTAQRARVSNQGALYGIS